MKESDGILLPFPKLKIIGRRKRIPIRLVRVPLLFIGHCKITKGQELLINCVKT
jgi:hypothetical protein